MLGGYYLGQLYLGISSWTGSDTLTIQNTDHGHTASSITLIQQHTIVVDNTTHSLTSDTIDLVEHKTLAVNSASHSLASDIISLIQQHTLAIADSLHGLTSENILLFQKHTLSVADSAHSHDAEGELVINEFFLLNQPDPGVFGVTSPEILITQNHILVTDNTMHMLVDSMSRIINWGDYNYYHGIYIKDFTKDGVIEQSEQEHGVFLVDKTKNVDTLVPAQVENGILIPNFNQLGQYN